jgi:hypothetical protein
MLLKRIAVYIKNHDWFAVVVEIFVIMIGLMLALQLDRWREEHQEQELELVYIDRLIDDIATDKPVFEYAIELQAMRLELVHLLMDVAENPQVALERPLEFLGAVDQAAYTYTPTLTNHTFENLRATGDMRLIQSETVKDLLFKYYKHDEEQRQYRPLEFMTESRHFELAAGVLDRKQITYIQNEYLLFKPDMDLSSDGKDFEALVLGEAAERLASRPELIAWLPYVRGMQLEQISVHQRRLEFADKTLQGLRDYLQVLEGRGR